MPRDFYEGSIELQALELLERAIPSEKWDSEHLMGTPDRYVKMLRELTDSEATSFDFTTFPNTRQVDQMVIMNDIPFYTFCAHHVIPFFGHAHIAYIPQDKIVGLSKLARAVEHWTKGLWAQEELCISICEYLEEHLDPLGVAVVMTAEHLCMTMRGVQTPGAKTTTSAMRGVFLDPTKGARNEFLSLIGKTGAK